MSLSDIKKRLLKDPEYRKDVEEKKNLAFEISEMLIEARTIMGITQKELADMMDTHQSCIARAESGKKLPSLSFIQTMADAYKSFVVPPKFGFMHDYDPEAVMESDMNVEFSSTYCLEPIRIGRVKTLQPARRGNSDLNEQSYMDASEYWNNEMLEIFDARHSATSTANANSLVIPPVTTVSYA